MWLEAIATRMEAVPLRLEVIATKFLLPLGMKNPLLLGSPNGA